MAGNIYEPVVAGTQFHQGEIISNVIQLIYDRVANELHEIDHGFCVIGSQECDLARDWEKKGEQPPILDGVLLFVADTAAAVRAIIGGKDIWKRVIQNKDERYQALEAVPAEQDLSATGFDALIVDFRRYFTVPPNDLYSQIEANTAQRRACLRSPYREHLQNRATAFLARVGLDNDHNVPMHPVPAGATEAPAVVTTLLAQSVGQDLENGSASEEPPVK